MTVLLCVMASVSAGVCLFFFLAGAKHLPLDCLGQLLWMWLSLLHVCVLEKPLMTVQFYHQFPGGAHLDPPMKEKTSRPTVACHLFTTCARSMLLSRDVQYVNHYLRWRTAMLSLRPLAMMRISSLLSPVLVFEGSALGPHAVGPKFGHLQHNKRESGGPLLHAKKTAGWPSIQRDRDTSPNPMCRQTETWYPVAWSSARVGGPCSLPKKTHRRRPRELRQVQKGGC